jgi:4-amino-4-deoxy-L-arabinose transferase-like glycosyltransferase
MSSDISLSRALRHNLYDFIADHPVLVLLVLAAIFLSLGWGQDGINLDSTTYSVIARNMAEQGRWFNPTYTPYSHTSFAEHPPLVMWMQAIIFLLFGAGDSTARLFGALCTAGSVGAVYLLGKEVGGQRCGFLSGLVLLLTYNFFQIGNSTLLDVPLTFFVLVTLWGLARLHNSRQPHLFGIVGLALGLGFLTKGVVSAPVWIAVLASVLLWHREWIKSKRFWLVPAIAVGLIMVHLLMDYIYTGGHFRHHYFLTQVWRRFAKGGPEIQTDWYQFAFRFARLYLPFVVLLPLGIYLVVRRRMTILYPTLVTLVCYFLFYSTAAKLYYHYFPPAYALAAPLVALPLAGILKERAVRRFQVWFFAFWIVLAVGVTVAGVRIHEIRCLELYSLKTQMLELLDGHIYREGLIIGQGEPDWDYVAKTSWYWRSDIRQVASIDDAVTLMRTDKRYAYIMVSLPERLPDEIMTSYRLGVYAVNDKVVVYIPLQESPR